MNFGQPEFGRQKLADIEQWRDETIAMLQAAAPGAAEHETNISGIQQKCLEVLAVQRDVLRRVERLELHTDCVAEDAARLDSMQREGSDMAQRVMRLENKVAGISG